MAAKTLSEIRRPTTPRRLGPRSRTPSSVESAATTAWVPRPSGRTALRHGERKANAEGRASAGRRLDADVTAVRRCDARDDRQAQPGTAGRALVTAGPRRVDPGEPLEDVLGLGGVQPWPHVDALEDGPPRVRAALGAPREGDRCPRRCVLQRVADEVAEHLTQSHLVADHDGR